MKAFLIPGSGEDLKSRNYQSVLDTYKQCGYDPVFVPIEWKYKTIDSWVGQVKAQIPQRELENSLLSGFSWGAMAAFTVAAQYANPKKLLLFSLSPYFKEDFPMPPKYEVWAGKRRVENFKDLSFDQLSPHIKGSTIIFIGSKEIDKYKDMDFRSKEALKKISKSKLIVVDGVGHDVGDPKYVAAIREELKRDKLIFKA